MTSVGLGFWVTMAGINLHTRVNVLYFASVNSPDYQVGNFNKELNSDYLLILPRKSETNLGDL